MRRLAFLLATAALFTLQPVMTANAGSGFVMGGQGASNMAVARNRRDGGSLFRFAFSVTRLGGSSIRPTNLVVADARCRGCRTVAVGFQVVFAGSGNRIVATNRVVARNTHCRGCQTLAAAYQFVVADSQPVAIGHRDREQLRAIRARLEALGRSRLPPERLTGPIDQLAARLQAVLNNLRPAAPTAVAAAVPRPTAAAPGSRSTATTPTSPGRGVARGAASAIATLPEQTSADGGPSTREAADYLRSVLGPE